jgi:hypothetical protein
MAKVCSVAPETGRRDRIEPSAAKGMTAQQPPGRQHAASQRAVHGNGFGRVLRARGPIFAAARADRVQRGRKPTAVGSDDGKQEARHGAGVIPAKGVEAVRFAFRSASILAISRIRTISASSCVNSTVRTLRRG